MIVYPNPMRRQKRMKSEQSIDAPLPPVGQPLVLQAAQYDNSIQSLTMQFDRAINIDQLDSSQITVDDGINNHAVLGNGGNASLVDPATVILYLSPIDAYGGDQVLLNATALTGIVAVDDGGTWAGVDGMVIG